MTDVVIKIEVKMVVDMEECGNECFHIEEESRDENKDMMFEIELSRYAIKDFLEQMDISFDETEDVLYPDSGFDEVFRRRLNYHKPKYPAAFIIDTFMEEFLGIFEETYPNADRNYYFI